MRFCILSDIHGNLEALTTVLEDSLQENADAYLCAGDVVGYGADPGECVRIVTRRCLASVAGNHDWAVIGKMDLQYFNPMARQAILWTKARLLPSDIGFLSQLELSFTCGDFAMVHATLFEPHYFHYLDR